MTDFREGIGMQSISKLKYGAAYFPFIDTIFQYEYDESLTMVQVGTTSVETDVQGLRISYLKRDNRVPGVEIINSKPSLYFEKDNNKWLIEIKGLGDGCAPNDLISVLPDSCVGYSIGAEGSEEETIGAETTFIKDEKYNFISGLKGLRIQANENDKGLPKVAFCEGNNLDFTIIADENKLIIHLPSGSPKTAEEVLSAWNAKISGELAFDALSFTFSKLGDGSGEIKLSDGPPRRGVVFEGENVINEQPERIFLLVYYGDLIIDAIKPIRFDFVVKNISSGATPSLAIIGLGQDGTSSDEIAGAAIDFDIYPFRIEKLPIDNETPDSSLSSGSQSLASLQDTRTGLYNLIKRKIEGERVSMLPPSGAIAGLFAAVDGTRGVWKAPANIGLIGVVGPSLRLTDSDHENLNVNADTGKSINAIRNYTGKGTMVMGARTLAGNDNEWRYVNVRRLFIMAETAIKKATEAFIFEPNTTTTWLKVKGMIESYLHGLWQSGALAGSKPEQAYFVNVGLGKTMSQDDILNGRMLVDVGLAAVRPAEFIVLRFSHKMQEA
ncbi:MAG: phage tail sheath family protein [Saprospiraceae bacterium]|nr:phage tail sheath family protein [Saprospiraceae bacterium]